MATYNLFDKIRQGGAGNVQAFANPLANNSTPTNIIPPKMEPHRYSPIMEPTNAGVPLPERKLPTSANVGTYQAFTPPSQFGGPTTRPTSGEGWEYLDQSARNSAIGDGFSGKRDGFLWVGGQRMSPVTGSDAEDSATLYNYGYRPPGSTGGGSDYLSPFKPQTPSGGPVVGGQPVGPTPNLPTPAVSPIANPSIYQPSATAQQSVQTQVSPIAGGGPAVPNQAATSGKLTLPSGAGIKGTPTARSASPLTSGGTTSGTTTGGTPSTQGTAPSTGGQTGAPSTAPSPVGNVPMPRGNPQVNRIGVDQSTGRLTLDGNVLDRRDPRMFGSVGRNVLDVADADAGAFDASAYDPRYYEPYIVPGSEGDGGKTRYRLKPEVEQRLHGRIQLGQSGIGGFGEVRDPSKIEWDDEFGFLTPRDNINQPDPGTFFDQYGAWLMVGGAALAVMGPAIAAGVGAGEGAGAGAAIQAADMAVPTITSGAGIPALAGAPEILAPAAATAGGGGALASLGNAARTVGQVGGAVTTIDRLTGNHLLGGGNHGSSGGGNSGGGNGFLSNVGNLMGGAVTQDRNRRNINDYRDLVSTLIERGDPYGPQRADAIKRLNQLEADPGSVTKNPLFSSMNTKSQEDLARIMSARGYLNSGNESGALQENFLANMNKFYGDEWTRTAREAGVFIDPGTSVQAGLTGGGNVLRANNNNDAATTALLGSLFGGNRGGGSGGGDIWDTIWNWFNGSDNADIPDSPYNGSYNDVPDSRGGSGDYYDDSGWGGT